MELVADPNDCTQYYVCLGDGLVSDHSVPCDNGTYFNETEGGCIDGLECENLCGGGGGGGVGCQLSCTFDTGVGELEFVSDVNCSRYYVCFAGSVQGPFDCPAEHKYFDGEKCGDSPAKCCNREACDPYCPSDGVVVPDPKDCHHFYYCAEEGTPDDIFRFECPSGKIFNLQLGECSSDSKCETICNKNSSETVQPGKTTTTTPSSSTCTESLTCPDKGYYPVCPFCDPRFLTCGGAGEEATLHSCPGELLFHPTSHYCILPENCSPKPILV